MRLLSLAAAVPLVAADWAGAGACRTCHPAIVDKHAASPHASALRRANEHPLAPLFRTGDRPLLRDGFLIAFTGDSAEAFDAENQLELPLDWAFGSGRKAVSFLTRMNPEWHFEHSYSLYPGAKRFLLTPGHGGFRPSTVKEAAGVLRDRAETARCFGCHSTGPVAFADDGSAEPREAGVQCEACHGPASDHVARKAKLGPAKKAMAAVCARCHDQPPMPRDAETWAVRSQPAALSASRCFVRSKGKLGCVTCHDPHAEARTDAAFYNAKCESCHKKVAAAQHGGDCSGCHMPRVAPQAGLRYANHRIGIYAGDAKLTPLTKRGPRGKPGTRRESAAGPAPK